MPFGISNRWSETEVVRLLDDIYQNGKKNYCLQPVVVRKKEDQYELIDGQQRLTTLYLIYKYMVFTEMMMIALRIPLLLLAPGENRHFGPGENNQFEPDENRQSIPRWCSQPRSGYRF